jgi:hypothetical protein
MQMSIRFLGRHARNLSLTVFAVAAISSVFPPAYADNAPRDFKGRAGENEFAASQDGLQSNEKVRINGQDDLSKIITGEYNACVYSITLTTPVGTPDKYVLTVDAQGPQGGKPGTMYLEFVDGARDVPARYYLALSQSARATHTLPVDFQGKKPAIKLIKWSNTPIDKP